MIPFNQIQLRNTRETDKKKTNKTKMEREKERKQGIQLGASLWFGHKDGDQFCAGSYDKDIVRET